MEVFTLITAAKTIFIGTQTQDTFFMAVDFATSV
jgi:hypothetical protein